ncbi:uncharacterized protein BJ212DRAFT_925686 [Suillus subaureus]|uniref:Secreted protein n=1 Tax=Suillus subaureus TaxID=48587 RepID=A0A9P7EH75_9AGAM|nr:uncharacterized protein BJ212DRAFT_925686 [Suillus subaureus]KAG1821838.1 hypothetical protein BJ212DRAFT_925686 [Suillus subaureus]
MHQWSMFVNEVWVIVSCCFEFVCCTPSSRSPKFVSHEWHGRCYQRCSFSWTTVCYQLTSKMFHRLTNPDRWQCGSCIHKPQPISPLFLHLRLANLNLRNLSWIYSSVADLMGHRQHAECIDCSLELISTHALARFVVVDIRLLPFRSCIAFPTLSPSTSHVTLYSWHFLAS